MEKRDWYREKVENIFNILGTGPNGLTPNGLKNNLDKYGSNVLKLEKDRGIFSLIWNQINSPLVYILILAVFLMIYLGDIVDAVIILLVVILNTTVGSIQEGRAQGTLKALRNHIKSHAIVIRNGIEKVVEDDELVPGDVIYLKDGSLIPADARLLEVTDLKVNQSSLTGESEVVVKYAGSIPAANLTFNEQNNMVFRGTYVISGLAKAVVVSTGASTIIGKISEKLGDVDSEVPLKGKIKELSNWILGIVAVVSMIILGYGINIGYSASEMLLTVIAVAVSAIPESLPLVVTLTLATGVWRMSQKKVLVKRLQAVEALGQAKVIAVDKTGTITTNQMTVGEIFVNERYISVSGEGYNNVGEFGENGKKISVAKGLGEHALIDPDLDLVAKVSIFTAIASFDRSNDKEWILKMGDPTEAALIVLGEKFGLKKNEMENIFPKISEIPFSLNNKYHATVNCIGDKKMFSMAGGPEAVLSNCEYIWKNGKKKKLDKEERGRLDNVITEMSSKGYRILALACNMRPSKGVSEDNIPKLTFVGFVGISDAIRAEVYDSIKAVKEANMRIVMITGDHIKTAKAVATKVGVFSDGDLVLTGKEIRELSDDALSHMISKVTVFARVSPDDKLRIIEAFKKNGDIVAMTGDGINDALSLVAADLGVAMGQNGTEVARSAADIVLTDDNFGNIVEAAEEGRNIYWTIRKSTLYLLSTNVGELLVVLLAVLLGLPLPLLATQIIWLNLVTDTFLVAALAFDPKENNLMSDLYRTEGGKLIDRMMVTRILMISILMTIVTLNLFVDNLGNEMEKAWTISLTMLTVFQWFNIFNVKSHYKSIFSKISFNNPHLFVGLIIAIGLHLFAIYHPFMQKVLHTTGLAWGEWKIILLFGILVVVIEEIRKVLIRMYHKGMKLSF